MAQTFFPITPTEITAGAADEWTPMDAGALAPVGATGVILHIVNTAGFLGDRNIGVRKNGSSDDRHTDISYQCHLWAAIGVDASRIFEAYVESTTDIDIYVVGYTMSGVTFKTNADDMSLGFTGSWRNIDCSVEASGAIGLIFEAITVAGDNAGFRKNGSSDDRHDSFLWHIWAIIGCDASQICEGYIEDTSVDFFLVGYITDGATFNLNADDVSLDDIVTWLDLTALPDVSPAPNMGFIEVGGLSSSAKMYGFRKNGSSEDIYYDARVHPWGIVECDASRLIEGKIENLAVDFFVVGYSTEAAVAGLENKSANMGAKLIAGKFI